MLAVSQPRELDAAPHVDWINRGSRELVHVSVATRDDRGSNERAPAASDVQGNHIATFPFVRRKLAEIRAEKIRKRPGGIDHLIPPGEGRALRAFYDRGAHDGDGQIAAAARKNGFAETLRERVSVRPAQMLRPAQANAREPIPCPACAIAFQNAVEFSGRRCRFVATASERLAA